MASYTAFLDASVLYPAPLRDLLLELAVANFYRAKWTRSVQQKWVGALLRDRADLTREALIRVNDLMDRAVPDAQIEDYEPLIESLTLPDPGDRHVLAAAIKGRADAIVTWNLRDFPTAVLDIWGIEAQQPDAFLTNQFHLSQAGFLAAVKTVRARLRAPAKSIGEYLDILRRQGLLATVAEIEPYSSLI